MQSSKRIPIGLSHFGDLVDKNQNYQFVDKSLFIKEIVDDSSHVTLITRPRRWGKTLNLSMLEYFFAPQVLGASTSGMFDTLAIGQVSNGEYLHHQGQYPVIFISFKDVKEQRFDLAVDKIRALLSKTFRQHQEYLLHSAQLNEHDKQLFQTYLSAHVGQAVLEEGLSVLSELLYRGHQNKQVYILIDEYDTPLNYAYSHEYLDAMTEFMKNLFSAALKDNPYLKKGVMTGVLRISKDSMLSGLNNVKTYSVLHSKYAPYFGFTDSEVQDLFKQCRISYNMTTIREYYNGYHVGDQQLYNPWSIMQCLDEDGVLKPYWVNTADDRLLSDTLLQSTSAIKKQLQTLMNDESDTIVCTIDTTVSDTIRFENLIHDETALWSVLLSTGYLTPFHHNGTFVDTESRYHLGIPNQEVRSVYKSIFRKWLQNQLSYSVYRLFLEDLTSGRIRVFTQKLEEYLLTYGSYHDFVSESNYHTFLLGVLCGLTEDYWLYSNTEAGQGRADMILVPKNPNISDALILECKRDKNIKPSKKMAEAALTQIDDRQYQAFITRHATIHRILKIGLVFNGKQVASAYRLVDC